MYNTNTLLARVQICPFGAMPDQKTMRWRCLGAFLYVGTKTFALSRKKLGCLAQKRTFLPQNMHFWPFFGKYRLYISCWLWRADCSYDRASTNFIA